MKKLIALLFFLSFSCNSLSLEPKKEEAAPIILDLMWNHNIDLPLSKIKVNGKEYNFLFDTGAPLILSEKLIKSIRQSKKNKAVKVHDSLGNLTNLNSYTLPEMEINGRVFRDIKVLNGGELNKFPLSCLKIDGVLGNNLFKDLVVNINYKENKVTLSDSIDVVIKNEKLKQYKKSKMKFKNFSPYVKFKSKFIKGYFLFDTGSNGGISISNKILRENKKLKGFLDNSYSYILSRGSSTYGYLNKDESDRITYLMNNFHVGGVKVHQFPVSSSPTNGGLIGNKFIKNIDVILNYRDNTIYMKKHNGEKIKKSYSNKKGFGFDIAKDNGIITCCVIKGSNAENKGIKPGMKVISINGRDTSEFKESDICKLNNNNDLSSVTVLNGDLKSTEILSLTLGD